MKRLALIISTIILFFIDCEKTEEYSEIPFIKYQGFIFDKEIINGFENQIGFLQFDFVDGNGDIGFAENSDTITDIEIPDVFIYKYTKINGVFTATDTIYFLLPYFSEGIYRKYIKGDMKIKIYLINQVNDTIKFDFQIMDRAYQLSNLESTPEFIVPEWN